MRERLGVSDSLLSLVVFTGLRLFEVLVYAASKHMYLDLTYFVIILADCALKLPKFIRVLAFVLDLGKEELDRLTAVYKEPN